MLYLRWTSRACAGAESPLLNPKKVYCVDTGLEYAVSSRRIDVVPFWDWRP